MTKTLDALRIEQLRWRAALDISEAGELVGAGSGFDELLFRLRSALAVYRRQVLPHLAAERELVLPALIVAEDDLEVVSGYARAVSDELASLVERLDAAEAELLENGASTAVRTRAAGLLAAAAALATVAMRFGSEVVLPRLSADLGPHDSEQLVDAVHAFENSVR